MPIQTWYVLETYTPSSYREYRTNKIFELQIDRELVSGPELAMAALKAAGWTDPYLDEDNEIELADEGEIFFSHGGDEGGYDYEVTIEKPVSQTSVLVMRKGLTVGVALWFLPADRIAKLCEERGFKVEDITQVEIEQLN